MLKTRTQLLLRGTKVYRAELGPLPPGATRPFAPTLEDALMFSTLKQTSTIVVYELRMDTLVEKNVHNYGYVKDGKFIGTMHTSWEYVIPTDNVRSVLTVEARVEW